MVPTIIDTELNQPLKGKQAFEYLINIKYFNTPTNNIAYLNSIQNPNINEDSMANNLSVPNMAPPTMTPNLNKNSISNNTNELFSENETLKFYEQNKDSNISKISNEMVKERSNMDSKLSVLLKLKRK
jgi:hypothetical protein